MLRYPYVCRRSAPLPSLSEPDHEEETTVCQSDSVPSDTLKYNYILLSIYILVIIQKFTTKN